MMLEDAIGRLERRGNDRGTAFERAGTERSRLLIIKFRDLIVNLNTIEFQIKLIFEIF